MRAVVTGGTGFVGRDIVEVLLERGDSVCVVTRDASRLPTTFHGLVETCTWDDLDLSGVQTVVHLAGENLFGKRWNDAQKRRILDSRVKSSATILDAIAKADPKPAVLVHASAVGYYGARGDEELDEATERGTGFLADVCAAWEDSCAKAREHGCRVVPMRIGIVLDEGGGAFAQMEKPFRFFVGGPVGSGDQWMSWIHRRDLSRLFLLAIDDERCDSPMNAVAPYPVRMRTFAKALGKAIHRPSWLKVPSFAIKLALGEVAQAVLEGQRVMPKRARELGFEFEFPELAEALEEIVTVDPIP